MTAVPIRLASSVELGPSGFLFRMSADGWKDYDVTGDGSRFLVVENLPDPDANAITVTTNWVSRLRR